MARARWSSGKSLGRAGCFAAALLPACLVGGGALRTEAGSGRRRADIVPVMTYNVLAPDFGTPEFFAYAEAHAPGSTAADARWPKIEAQLRWGMQQQAIIAIQEIDAEWAVKLANRWGDDYALFWKPTENLRVGVALAWPRAVYEVEDDVRSYVALPHSDSWTAAYERSSATLFARLRSRTEGWSVWVASCYMAAPSSRETQRAQLIHIHEVMRQLHFHAQDDPAIFLGGFNFMPDSPQYALVASGRQALPEAFAHGLANFEGLEPHFAPDAPQGMRSAFRTCLGEEPPFTAQTWTSSMYESGWGPFVGTLDYVWMSGGIAAAWCKPLPDVGVTLPSAEHGSDHLPLMAWLQVPVAKESKAASSKNEGSSGMVDSQLAGERDMPNTFDAGSLKHSKSAEIDEFQAAQYNGESIANRRVVPTPRPLAQSDSLISAEETSANKQGSPTERVVVFDGHPMSHDTSEKKTSGPHFVDQPKAKSTGGTVILSAEGTPDSSNTRTRKTLKRYAGKVVTEPSRDSKQLTAISKGAKLNGKASDRYVRVDEGKAKKATQPREQPVAAFRNAAGRVVKVYAKDSKQPMDVSNKDKLLSKPSLKQGRVAKGKSQAANNGLGTFLGKFEGTLKSFNAQKGYGFLACRELGDVYVPASVLQKFHVGERVSFKAFATPLGIKARI